MIKRSILGLLAIAIMVAVWPLSTRAANKNVWITLPQSTQNDVNTALVLVNNQVNFQATTSWPENTSTWTWQPGGFTIVGANNLQTCNAAKTYASPGTEEVTATYHDEISYALKVIAVQLAFKSIKFTSDHAQLLSNTTDWTDSGSRYDKPEWVPSLGRNNPISQTKNTTLTADVTVNVQPSGLSFHLAGAHLFEAYLSFDSDASSTGADQVVPVAASAALPNYVYTDNPQLTWAIGISNQISASWSSGPHTIFVTWGTPYSEYATYKRMQWVTDKGYFSATENALAVAIRDAARAGADYEQGHTDPSPIWNALLKDRNHYITCFGGAKLAQAALRLLGLPDVQTSLAYATGYDPSGNKDASNLETRNCSTHGTLRLRFVTSSPPMTEANPSGAYLNEFEGCFTVSIGGTLNYYTVWETSGPFTDPNALWQVINNIKNNSSGGFGQWWSYDLNGVRYWDQAHYPSSVPLPP